MLSISLGNSKFPHTPNFSNRPIYDCANCKYCAPTCYALKAYKQYPIVKKAWDKNSKAIRGENYGKLYNEISDFLIRRNPSLFRIHVAGDFINQGNLELWAMIANDFPHTKFLAFTKCFDLDFSDLPPNLQIIFSMYPNQPDDAPSGPRAWVQDGSEDRIPENAIECGGLCENCGMCWELSSIKRDVFFHIH